MTYDEADGCEPRPVPVGPNLLREALKLVAVVLKEGEVDHALAGSYGLWARGGPEPDHDVDFMVAEEDAARARDLLAARDLVVVQPPEDWLFKVFIEGAMVDVIFRVKGEPIGRGRFEDAEVMEVESVSMAVLSATVLMGDKLSAMEEHACDFTRVIPVARAVREQVDWSVVETLTADNPFAQAFLGLLRALHVVPPRGEGASVPRLTAQG
ncbi:hypothetical protein [Nocardioides sp. Root190]|uniref:hypothetical protein n=1 Tax=Nocardioides sp. Root190 TaxID=1736488 RepID=UPI000A9D367B|nr:hypothetical protein [Nocardioides sp. Root190]